VVRYTSLDVAVILPERESRNHREEIRERGEEALESTIPAL
jgi:hypothetical protein